MHLFKLKSRLSRIRASSDSYVLSAHKRTAQDPPNTTLHPFYMSQSKVNPNWTPPDPPLMSAFDHWYKCCPSLLDALCPLCHPSHPHTVSCAHDLSIFVQPWIIEVNHRMLFQQLLITLSFRAPLIPTRIFSSLCIYRVHDTKTFWVAYDDNDRCRYALWLPNARLVSQPLHKPIALPGGYQQRSSSRFLISGMLSFKLWWRDHARCISYSEEICGSWLKVVNKLSSLQS